MLEDMDHPFARGEPVLDESGQPQGRTATRQTHYFNAFVDYHVNQWFTAEVGYWLSRMGVPRQGSPLSVFALQLLLAIDYFRLLDHYFN